jgi:hypothetical protein
VASREHRLPLEVDRTVPTITSLEPATGSVLTTGLPEIVARFVR